MFGARRRGALSAGLATRRAITIIIGATASLWFTASASPVLAAPVCFDAAGHEVACVTPSTRAPSNTTSSTPRSAAVTTSSARSTTTTTARTTTTTGEANAAGGAVLRVNPPRSRPHSSSHTKTIVAIVGVVLLLVLAMVLPEVRSRRRRSAA